MGFIDSLVTVVCYSANPSPASVRTSYVNVPLKEGLAARQGEEDGRHCDARNADSPRVDLRGAIQLNLDSLPNMPFNGDHVQGDTSER